MSEKKRDKIKKAKTQPATKSKVLESMCNDEQLALIRSLAKKGSAFIVLGSDHAAVKEFYKGLNQEMYSSTSNGVATYDTFYKFKNPWDRPIITISINDRCNIDTSIIDSIKQLSRYRTKTLYTYHYENAKGAVVE